MEQQPLVVKSQGRKSDSIGRLDQFVARHPQLLHDRYGDDANLVLDILSFVCTKFRNNLFNNFGFTLGEFCKRYNNRYKENLLAIHPAFKKDTLERTSKDGTVIKRPKKNGVKPYVSEKDGHVWDSVFEHTLFRMMGENIIYSEDVGNLKYLSRVRSLQLLKSVSISNVETRKGRQEFLYEVAFGDETFLNLFRYYTAYNEDSFIKIGKHKNGLGKRKVYLYLITQYQRCLLSKFPTNEVTPNFNMLCELANLKNAQVRNNKTNLIKILNELGVDDVLNFNHNLMQVDLDDKNFQIIIKFKTLKYLENRLESDCFNLIYRALNAYFENHIYIKHWESDTEADDEDLLKKFQMWVNSAEDIGAKATVLFNVLSIIFTASTGISADGCLQSIKKDNVLEFVQGICQNGSFKKDYKKLFNDSFVPAKK